MILSQVFPYSLSLQVVFLLESNIFQDYCLCVQGFNLAIMFKLLQPNVNLMMLSKMLRLSKAFLSYITGIRCLCSLHLIRPTTEVCPDTYWTPQALFLCGFPCFWSNTHCLNRCPKKINECLREKTLHWNDEREDDWEYLKSEQQRSWKVGTRIRINVKITQQRKGGGKDLYVRALSIGYLVSTFHTAELPSFLQPEKKWWNSSTLPLSEGLCPSHPSCTLHTD